jgi:hypothetical protein
MSRASRNSSRPPAMRKAPSEMPSTRKIAVPRAAKAARVMAVAMTARRAVRRRWSGGSDRVIDRNSGTAAGGSTTRNRVVSVESEKERTWLTTAPS